MITHILLLRIDFVEAARTGAQTRGPHVAREGILCGLRCFLWICN